MSRFITELEDILQINLSNDAYSTDQLCQDLGISRMHLHRKIKSVSGLSTALYIQNFKCEAAKKLLTDTELAIGEVASKVGYEDAAYFSRVFKSHCGSNPERSGRLPNNGVTIIQK